jgi:hypothetical protein
MEWGEGLRSENERSIKVNTFNNVDLPRTRPLAPNRPIGGPYSAAVSHRSKVGNEKSTIVCLRGRDTNARKYQSN